MSETLKGTLEYLGKLNQNVKDTTEIAISNSKDYFKNIPTINTPTKEEWTEFLDNSLGVLKDSWEDLKSDVSDIIIDGLFGDVINIKDQLVSVFSETKNYFGGISLEDIKKNINNFLANEKEVTKIDAGDIGLSGISGIKTIKSIARFNATTVLIDKSVVSKNLTDRESRITLINKTTSATSENQSKSIKSYLNANIGEMIASGPDMQRNMYDIYFSVNDDYSDAFSLLLSKDVFPDFSSSATIESDTVRKVLTSLVEDVYALSVRTSTVSIPLRQINTSSISFLSGDIEIPQTTWNVENTATLQMDMDSNTYLPEIFNALSGLKRHGDVLSSNKLTDNRYKIMAPYGLGKTNLRIDLYVSSHALSGYSNLKYQSYSKDNLVNVIFVFEDIKFLGSKNEISFACDDSKSKNFSVPFIYKNLKTMYKPDSLSAVSTGTGIAYNKDYDSYLNGSLETTIGEV